jgi:hypothetical protein
LHEQKSYQTQLLLSYSLQKPCRTQPTNSAYFCDNLFTKSKLFSQLRALGIGACSTARADVISPLFGKVYETWKPAWGTLWSKVQDNDTGDGVLISLWQDSAVVKFATTIHQGTEWVVQERKKPRDSSSSAAITKAPFEAFPAIGA